MRSLGTLRGNRACTQPGRGAKRTNTKGPGQCVCPHAQWWALGSYLVRDGGGSNYTSTHLAQRTMTRRLSGAAHLKSSAQGVTGASGDSDSDSAGRVGSEALFLTGSQRPVQMGHTGCCSVTQPNWRAGPRQLSSVSDLTSSQATAPLRTSTELCTVWDQQDPSSEGMCPSKRDSKQRDSHISFWLPGAHPTLPTSGPRLGIFLYFLSFLCFWLILA